MALVSDKKRIRSVYTWRCAIQIDNLYLFTFCVRWGSLTPKKRRFEASKNMQNGTWRPNCQFNAAIWGIQMKSWVDSPEWFCLLWNYFGPCYKLNNVSCIFVPPCWLLTTFSSAVTKGRILQAPSSFNQSSILIPAYIQQMHHITATYTCKWSCSISHTKK